MNNNMIREDLESLDKDTLIAMYIGLKFDCDNYHQFASDYSDQLFKISRALDIKDIAKMTSAEILNRIAALKTTKYCNSSIRQELEDKDFEIEVLNKELELTRKELAKECAEHQAFVLTLQERNLKPGDKNHGQCRK